MSGLLFKMVHADGRAPFVAGYVWSLPCQNKDGSWRPGDWHEHDGAELRIGHGLHLTPYPHIYARCDLHCYVAEATEVAAEHGSDQVVARRARLLRPATAEEVETARRAYYEAEEDDRKRRAAEAAKARAKQQADRLAKASKAAREHAKADADAGVESPALTAFRVLVELGSCDSWTDVNTSRRSAITHAVRFLRFNPGDVSTICRSYGGEHWLDAERLYADAIVAGNTSACVAMEKFLDRKPWWFTRGSEKRQRLYVGASLRLNNEWLRITSFRAEHLNAVRADEGASSGVVKIRREDLAPKPAQKEVAA